MKLKTKFQDEDFDLGEVVEGVIVECLGKHDKELRVIATAAKGGQHTFYYSSIKKFMDDWEDAPEEPKEYWFITSCGAVEVRTEEEHPAITDMHKRFGNCFSSQEEAIKARDRQLALTRLKDKGFKVDLWDYDGGNYQERIRTGRMLFRVKDYEENDEDLDLLFGGEK